MSSLKPLNRKELFATAIAGEGEAPKALNRKELFATAVAGQGEAPSPLNRQEVFATEIADNISGGSGDFELYYTTGVYKENDVLTAEDKTALSTLASDPMTYCAFMFPRIEAAGITYRCPLGAIKIGVQIIQGSNGPISGMPRVSCMLKMDWATDTVSAITGYVPTSTNSQTYDNIYIKIYKYKL